MKLNNILFFILTCTSLSAASQQPVLADYLFIKGAYERAITEYKRYIYQHGNVVILDSVYLQMARSYRYLGDIEKSDNYLDLSMHKAQTQSIINQIEIEKAVNKLITGHLFSASSSLKSVLLSTNEPDTEKQALYYLSIAYLLDADYMLAKYLYSQYMQLNTTCHEKAVHERIITLLDSASMVDQKTPKKAKLFSTFLPGLGQAYCKSYSQGINAFMVNGSLIWLITCAVVKSNYINAVVLAYFFRMFYSGNRFRTEIICEDYNKALDDHLQEIILLEFMEGISVGNDSE